MKLTRTGPATIMGLLQNAPIPDYID